MEGVKNYGNLNSRVTYGETWKRREREVAGGWEEESVGGGGFVKGKARAASKATLTLR